MRQEYSLASVAALLFIVNTSIAQQTDDVIAPFVDAETLAVVRADLANVDANVVLDWLVAGTEQQGLDAPTREMLRRWWKPSFDRWGGLMTEARDAGAKRAYWLLNLQDLLDRQGAAGVWVFPIEGAADAQKVIDAMRSRQLEARRIGDTVIGSRPGRSVAQGGAAALPPIWAHALAARQGAAIRVAVVPTQILRRSFEENVTSLPLAGGPVPVTTLTRGVEWINISAELPPTPNVKMAVQTPDGPTANAIAKVVESALTDIRAERERLLPPLRAAAELAAVQAPTVVGDQVRWEPDFQKLVMPVLVRETINAARDHSAQNIRQLLLGVVMYANNLKGQAPPDLNVVLQEQDLSPDVLRDPLNPQAKVGFIYIRPLGDWQKEDSEVPVIYESTPEGHNVGFADGHVEWLATRKEVEDRVKAAEARNRAAGEGKK
jgi:prepilin-type processing-associated H-X9-DG protein